MLDMSPWWWWLFLTCPPHWTGVGCLHCTGTMSIGRNVRTERRKHYLGGNSRHKTQCWEKGKKVEEKLTSPPVPLPLIPPPLPLPPPWNSTCKQIRIKWSGRTEVRSLRTFEDSKEGWTFPRPLIAPLAPPFCPETRERRRRSRKTMHNWRNVFPFLILSSV